MDIVLDVAQFPLFIEGDLTFHQNPTFRPAEGGETFDFRRGMFGAYFPAPRIITLASSPVIVFDTGHIAIVTNPVPAVGAVSGFAVWPLAAPDPSKLLVESATSINSGNVSQAYTRHSAVFSLPSDARYLGVGGKFYSVPYASSGFRTHYLKKVQVEKAPVGQTGPSAYSQAREIQTVIYPDRLNYSPNPGFYLNTSNWTLLSRVASAASSTGWEGQIAIPAGGTGLPVHTVPNLKPGETYTVSAEVVSTAPVTLTLYGVRFSVSSLPQRVSATFVAGSQPESITFAITGSVGASTVTVREVMVEHGNSAGEYFDGSTGPDYVWETGGTVGATRSYYYKNRAERYAAVVRILQENTPMGIGIDVPTFGVLPS